MSSQWQSADFECRSGLTLLGLIFIFRLVKEEIRGQFFILVARKVCLNDQISFESKPTKLAQALALWGSSWPQETYSFNSLAFLLRHRNGLRTRGDWGVLINVLAQKLHELFWV